jgi:DNA-binding NtrC family response regulator
MTADALEGARERVLVVEDDAAVARLLELILANEGYECTLAKTIADAARHLRTVAFDVMVCDVRLPDGSGLDLVEQAIAARPQLAALVISGLDELALADRALRIGAYGYVVKPFTATRWWSGCSAPSRTAGASWTHKTRSARPARRRSAGCALPLRRATPAPPLTS